MARASLRGAMVAPPGSQPGATSGRSSCCWALRHATPPRGPSGSPGSRWRHSAARATSCPAGPPSPRRSHAMPPQATDGPAGLEVGQSRPPPWAGAAIFRLSGETYCRAHPGPPRLSRCGVTAKPAVRAHSAGTPHGVRPVGVSDTRPPAASATAPRRQPDAGRVGRGRQAARLPGPSCHLGLTLPHDLTPRILAHKRPLVTLLCKAARQPRIQCGQRTLGGQSGGHHGPAHVGADLGGAWPCPPRQRRQRSPPPGSADGGRRPLPLSWAGLVYGLSRHVPRGTRPGRLRGPHSLALPGPQPAACTFLPQRGVSTPLALGRP